MKRAVIGLGALLAAAAWAFAPGIVAADGTIEVKLTESPPSVTPSSTSTAPGDTIFQAENVGAIPHELVVIRTDLAADALPVSGDTVDLDQLDVIADSDTFDAGASGPVTASLESGSYVLICNLPGHYGLGMRAALNVTGEATDGAPPASTGNGGPGTVADASGPWTIGLAAFAFALILGTGALLRRHIAAK